MYGGLPEERVWVEAEQNLKLEVKSEKSCASIFYESEAISLPHLP